MTSKEDFDRLKADKQIAEIAIDIRSNLEYTFRSITEQMMQADMIINGGEFDTIPENIKSESIDIMTDVKALISKLNKDHKDFLTI